MRGPSLRAVMGWHGVHTHSVALLVKRVQCTMSCTEGCCSCNGRHCVWPYAGTRASTPRASADRLWVQRALRCTGGAGGCSHRSSR